MPIYEYKCCGCGKIHEIIQKFSDAPITECPSCKGMLKKMISNTSFVLKGSGWYVTDYPSADRKRDMTTSSPSVPPVSTPSDAPASAPAVESTSKEKSSSKETVSS
ncbi:MAG: zinc ribbon domain-containing protein [Nitrospirae bacterium]|nr:zinc ribbon domain-containing protein [Nitrospirota bacterium]MBF0540040.1 zinc ribbon domain-containing protein [Nitrospirota bacterium]